MRGLLLSGVVLCYISSTEPLHSKVLCGDPLRTISGWMGLLFYMGLKLTPGPLYRPGVAFLERLRREQRQPGASFYRLPPGKAGKRVTRGHLLLVTHLLLKHVKSM